MIRIKDDVDLDFLKKYKFEKIERYDIDGNEYFEWEYNNPVDDFYISIPEDTRIIYFSTSDGVYIQCPKVLMKILRSSNVESVTESMKFKRKTVFMQYTKNNETFKTSLPTRIFKYKEHDFFIQGRVGGYNIGDVLTGTMTGMVIERLSELDNLSEENNLLDVFLACIVSAPEWYANEIERFKSLPILIDRSFG